MGRIAETRKRLNPSTASEEELRRLIQSEAGVFVHEIEAQFVRAGKLELPVYPTANAER